MNAGLLLLRKLQIHCYLLLPLQQALEAHIVLNQTTMNGPFPPNACCLSAQDSMQHTHF